ncbi:hypothetical protein NC652_031159 [Populus alba x Populus x berolinensis]|uniref:Uncharacterized protein n=1 Tax=Populus tomentosa TaxID=118781 RepID=A0A8X7YMU4_POPTO|nr:hypothetical protein POTOM_044137 [Populus tomentosa]KAJ6884083.1 hypothetical protein NC652_031153 [Populus alba x Populus x berolinensis]KAJ6884089.1 hypothetical protein NC652_031159 [Populus alba x Populus x berolinensis]
MYSTTEQIRGVAPSVCMANPTCQPKKRTGLGLSTKGLLLITSLRVQIHKANLKMKHQSSIANDVIHRCAQKLGVSVEKLVEEFEAGWKQEIGDYSRKLVEFCCSKALTVECPHIQEKIIDGSFSRLTFDMMLAWEMPTSQDEESHMEQVGKGREDRKLPENVPEEQDDIPLFYTDLMPLLVNEEPSIGEDAFVWLGSLVPLVVDVVNGRFAFETLTAPTGHRLFFPGYKKFLQEIDKCIKHLQKHAKPKGVELADDEFILHVEGTASSQRVVRHVGGTSWPGRLTLTNYALYFEAMGVITYDDALKIDLSKNISHTVKPAATGPWGAPLFDKAIIYESPEFSEGIVLEFPEMTSSTRRDHWLALVKEVMLMHQFLSSYNVECPIQAWEMHARTISGIIRLHAARELLRISPPSPTKFLIFALFDELPKGDYVLEQLAESLKKVNSGHPCSACSILRTMNMSQSVLPGVEVEAVGKECTSASGQDDIPSSLESAIDQVREEAKEVEIAKATTEVLKEDGIGESATVLMELLKPLENVVPWFQDVVSWRRPATTLTMIVASLVIIYKEWVGKAISAGLLWLVLKMILARYGRSQDKCNEVVVCSGSNQKTTMESIVAAQFGLKNVHEMMQLANISILKIQSLIHAKARKIKSSRRCLQQADVVMAAMTVLAIILAVVPLKYMLIAITLHSIIITSKLGRHFRNAQGNRRLKEWWDSIPIVPIHVVEDASQCPS